MLRRVQSLAGEFRNKGWPPVAIGVGVNTGRMSVGNMGSDLRVSYTVMGDAVNLASRIEGITKQYGVSMLVGENTRAAVPDVVFREVDRVRVKGKDEPVAIYEPLGLQGEVDKATLDQLKLFQQAQKFYRAKDWDKAELQLLNLQKLEPNCALYGVYLKRTEHFRKNPPEAHWDGVFDFETK
jgi:adenylate cyclase